MTSAADSRPPFDDTALHAEFDPIPYLEIELLAETESTNRVAAERARSGAADGLVVLADHQTAGRGRLDRTWETPAGTAVTYSMVLRPTVEASQWPWLPLLAGHTVAKALTGFGYDARVKWPNDVLIGEEKVAGILVERVETDGGPAAVVGVGINVDLTADELPVPTATSLSLAANGNAVPSRQEVLTSTVAGIREGFDTWQVGGQGAAERLASSYAAHCSTLGRDVQVSLPTGDTLVGRATAIDPDGRLVVETEAGETRVGAGDVIHVRPA